MRRCSFSCFVVAVCSVAVLAVGCGSKSARQKPAVSAAPVNTERLAAKAFDSVKTKTPLNEDSRTNAYIICVAEEVIRDFHGDWEIAIFQQRSPSLFVLPARKIGVNSGIMQVVRNQHQLAALIAHSLAHVVAHHPEKRLVGALGTVPTGDATQAVERPFSADGQAILQAFGIVNDRIGATPYDASEEAEANVLELELMAQAGFNPRESSIIWRALDGNAAARSNGMPAAHPAYGNRSAVFEAHSDRLLQLQQDAAAKRRKPDCDRIRR